MITRYDCSYCLTVTEEDMRTHFGKYGELAFIQIKRKPGGESRGYGFIRFVEVKDQASHFYIDSLTTILRVFCGCPSQC